MGIRRFVVAQRNWLFLALTMVGVVLVAGCGSEGDAMQGSGKHHHMMSLAAAQRKSDEYLEAAKKALDQDAKLTDVSKQPEMKCEHGPSGTFFTQQGAQVAGLKPHAAQHYFAAMRKWWASNGFHINHEDQRDGRAVADNPTDGFSTTLEVYDSRRYYIDVVSPCVTRDGNPPDG